MCRTYNRIGSLTTLISHLEKNNIHEFKSLNEVINFQNSYTINHKQILTNHENLIVDEGNMLKLDLQNLDIDIKNQREVSEQKLTIEIEKLKQKFYILLDVEPINFFKKLTWNIRKCYLRTQIKHRETNFDKVVRKSIKKLLETYKAKSIRYQFINSHFCEAVKLSSQHDLSELERKKTIIDNLNSYIFGALGEQKVVKALEALSDDYILINDFTLFFSPGIYNRQKNDYIKSIQIDHILVSPSGVFLIETKNWSEKSMMNSSLHSPVQQIKRTSNILFKLLNNELTSFHLKLDKHHWGRKKISIKNLIVLTNTKPKEEFQYVKILTVSELIGYICYFKPIYTSIETQRIADFLLKVNDLQTIKNKMEIDSFFN